MSNEDDAGTAHHTLSSRHKAKGAVTLKRSVDRCGLVLVLAALLSVATEAHAGMVYGRVSLSGSPFPKDHTFLLEGQSGKVKVKPDQGNYRVFLAPGQYVARYADEHGAWEAQIESYPGPLQQDIVFQKR